MTVGVIGVDVSWCWGWDLSAEIVALTGLKLNDCPWIHGGLDIDRPTTAALIKTYKGMPLDTALLSRSASIALGLNWAFITKVGHCQHLWPPRSRG